MNNLFIIDNELYGQDPSFPENEVKFTKKDFLDNVHLNSLIRDLNLLKEYWLNNQEFIDGSLLQVNYYGLVPKSKRIKVLFRTTNFKTNIVGAKYNYYDQKIGLSIVYYSHLLKDIDILSNILNKVSVFLDEQFNGFIDRESFLSKYNDIHPLFSLTKNDFSTLLLELSRIRGFACPSERFNSREEQVVKFYINPFKLKKALDIHVLKSSLYDNIATLSQKDIEYIQTKAPYLLSQCFEKKYENPSDSENEIVSVDVETLDSPRKEGIIGVIEGAISKNTYLKEWVTTEDLRTTKDYSNIDKLSHATKVCSLLVHGGEINKELGLDDKCGHFRVKHFAILDDYNDIFEINERIEKVVRENYKTIKVWNLSIGTDSEIPENFISPLACLLDKLQYELDIIFVVSATNKPKTFYVDDNYKIGSPADSINSIVVGSARMTDKLRATYSRKGGVLNFFIKPDVSFYGGDIDKKIVAFNGFNYVKSTGTSFAAPFIARKLAFLIYNAGFTREEAKALIIHSAHNWNDRPEDPEHLGRGIVYSDITDILSTPEDEVRFVFKNTTKAFYSDNYSLPIPVNSNGKTPFSVKATLCYFTSCSPNYGVDYTNTEVDFKFGPVFKTGLSSITDDGQYELGRFVNEEDAREEFSKWDNVKHIYIHGPKSKNGIKTAEKWGFKLTTSYRNGFDGLGKHEKYNFPVGIVVTLKSVDGVNRSNQFRREVERTNWTIKQIDVDSLININVDLKQKIEIK